MASLHDVARLAGVSKSTVSRVINDEYGVKEATKIKVRRAIEECGYVVNQVAKDLKSNKTFKMVLSINKVNQNEPIAKNNTPAAEISFILPIRSSCSG